MKKRKLQQSIFSGKMFNSSSKEYGVPLSSKISMQQPRLGTAPNQTIGRPETEDILVEPFIPNNSDMRPLTGAFA